MNTAQKSGWMNSKNVLVFLLGVALIYIITSSLVDSRFKAVEISVRAQISEQQALMSAIAEITARNGADAVTESIVRDCPLNERSQFDTLLGELNNELSHTQLVELERLFGRCASFSSDRKSVMVSRLARETEIYRNYVNQLSIVLEKDIAELHEVEKWSALATEETKQSKSFSELVLLQDKIISSLLNGQTIQSDELIEILQEVKEVQEALAFTNQKASSIRAELIPL